MQTFLPSPFFEESADALDNRRLGKQRVETLQILNSLFQTRVHQISTYTFSLEPRESTWINHPATKMWKGYENALVLYGVIVCDEWISRGFKDTCRHKILCYSSLDEVDLYNPSKVKMPPWLGDWYFHLSHQSNLIRKDPQFYGPKFPGIKSNLNYVWPV